MVLSSSPFPSRDVEAGAAQTVPSATGAGVGTLGVTPVAFTRDERLEQLRLVAELAA